MSETAGKPGKRPVRSFVLRPGRMTTGQHNALERLWPDLGLSIAQGELSYSRAFGREADTVLEIGFGMGASLVEMAANRPDINFIGIEVHPPGVGSLLMACAERGIDNIRIYREDAVEVLRHCIASASLAGVQLYFPDPWPKKKHHKRRLVQADFIALIGSRLRPGAWLHMATDWQDYAEHMLAVMQAMPQFHNRAGVGQYSQRPDWRPKTKFELRGERLGHGVWDLIFDKSGINQA
jgi:tRNA (guanine-N7-)-methyltransferase